MKLLSQSLKERKYPFVIGGGVAALLVFLMVIGSFWDLEIAGAVAAKPGGIFYYGFGLTFEMLGFLPATLVDVSLFAALSVYSKKKGWKIFFHILCAGWLMGAVYCSVFWTLSNHGFGVKSYISAPVFTFAGAALSFPVIKLFKRIEIVKLKKIIYVLAIGAVMASLANLTTALLQVFWGRYRYFEVAGRGVPYAPWYMPLGRGNSAEGANASSFASMHCSSAASVIVLLMAGRALDVKRSVRYILAAAAAVMLVCVPLSRMVLGWHYLTDVTFALLESFIMLIAALIIIDAGFGKKFISFMERGTNYGTENVL